MTKKIDFLAVGAQAILTFVCLLSIFTAIYSSKKELFQYHIAVGIFELFAITIFVYFFLQITPYSEIVPKKVIFALATGLLAVFPFFYYFNFQTQRISLDKTVLITIGFVYLTLHFIARIYISYRSTDTSKNVFQYLVMTMILTVIYLFPVTLFAT